MKNFLTKYGELEYGIRLAHKSNMKFKNCFSIALTQTRISVVDWQRDAQDKKGSGGNASAMLAWSLTEPTLCKL